MGSGKASKPLGGSHGALHSRHRRPGRRRAACDGDEGIEERSVDNFLRGLRTLTITTDRSHRRRARYLGVPGAALRDP